MTREAAIVDRIIRWLKQQDGVYYEKRWGGPYGRAGSPDLSLCVRGRRVEIEVKNEDGRVTQAQQVELTRWQAAGAVVGVVRSLEDVRAIVEPLMDPARIAD